MVFGTCQAYLVASKGGMKVGLRIPFFRTLILGLPHIPPSHLWSRLSIYAEPGFSGKPPSLTCPRCLLDAKDGSPVLKLLVVVGPQGLTGHPSASPTCSTYAIALRGRCCVTSLNFGCSCRSATWTWRLRRLRASPLITAQPRPTLRQ